MELRIEQTFKSPNLGIGRRNGRPIKGQMILKKDLNHSGEGLSPSGCEEAALKLPFALPWSKRIKI